MGELPSGTVTFLFTDIEGSTRLWDEYPEEMQVALAAHDAILRGAVETGGGHVVKTTGDGIHAVFATARDALDAAVVMQLGLAAEPFGETGRLRVRIGVHTCEAERRDGDYYGSEVNRAARLMSVAHAGFNLLDVRVENGTDDEDLGAGVVDDAGDLARRQPPVHRNEDRVELGEREADLEVLRTVLVEKRDPVARPDPNACERIGELVRPPVKVTERDRAALELDRRRGRLVPTVRADDLSN